ncbi:MAG: hypothetical protein ACO1NW_11705 [Chitinophagaceae bacterium]
MTYRTGLLIVAVLLLISVLIFGNQIKDFFLNQTTAINVISVIGTIITVLSFLYGLYEKSEREKLESKRKSQLWASLDRARYVTFDHIILEQIDKQLTHDHKHRLWLVHQAACDLYISLIEQYLSMVDRFTYKDLESLVKNGLVFWKWQERQWRILISQRPENKDKEPPEYFLTQEGSNYLKQTNKAENQEGGNP